MKWNTEGAGSQSAARRQTPPGRIRGYLACGLALTALAGLCGCTFMKNMYEQPKYLPLRPSKLFADGTSARPPVPGTVARNALKTNDAYFAGRTANGDLVDALPLPLTKPLLQRGRERFDIFCSPCHDRTGSGNGMIVQRGFRPPPSYHIPRLREAPIGYFFDVMTNGFGVMPSYSYQAPAGDRWAIAAYVRTLQFSANATLDDVPPGDRQRLEKQR